MWIRKKHIKKLSQDIRKKIDGQPIELRDHVEGPLGILKNDIHTLLYRKEQQLSALKQDQRQMMDTLVNISHQIKTPLTSMMLMADLLEDAPSHDRDTFLANMKGGLLRMEWFATALLKMAKLDGGVVDFEMETIPFRQLVEKALESLQILLDIKGQHITLAGEDDFTCDISWTREALGNVIKNAMEASPEGATIHIACGKNPICRWIAVTDQGPGIDKATRAKLFTRFGGSGQEGSYGIGLALALGVMHRQNGDIAVDPGGDGVGATFTLKFF